VQQLKLQKQEKNSTQKMALRENECVQIECCGSFGLLPAETEIYRSQSEI
jgi:hypothetical protein